MEPLQSLPMAPALSTHVEQPLEGQGIQVQDAALWVQGTLLQMGDMSPTDGDMILQMGDRPLQMGDMPPTDAGHAPTDGDMPLQIGSTPIQMGTQPLQAQLGCLTISFPQLHAHVIKLLLQLLGISCF